MIFAYTNQEGVVIQYPIYLSTIRAEFPNVSFVGDPSPDAVIGAVQPFLSVQHKIIVRVVETGAPAPKDFASIKELTPKFEGNVWRQQWDQPDVEIESARAMAIRTLDQMSDNVRKAAIGNDTNALEYMKAEDEAKYFRDMNFTGNAGPAVASWARIKGWSEEQAAKNILAVAELYNTLLYAIRETRLTAKQTLKGLTTVSEIREVYKTTRDTLNVFLEQAKAAQAA